MTALDVCVVHLHRAIDRGGLEKQQEQDAALKVWAQKILHAHPKANIIVLGDFNESKNVGDSAQALAGLVQGSGALTDTFSLAGKKIRTHADGKALDRILISEAMTKGTSWLKFNSVSSNEHKHGKGEDRKLYTDHFPVTAAFALAKPGGTSSTSP